MKKPIIALTPLFDDDLESIWMLNDYLEAIFAAGGIPVILPLDIKKEDLSEVAARFDGFLFTGGQDVEPALYGEEKMECCGGINSRRDSLEIDLFREVLKHDKPVLGICRGLQVINVALGGTLYQDIAEQLYLDKDTAYKQDKPYEAPFHPVDVIPGTPLHSILHTDKLDVNSLHHQAVKDLSPKLKAAAISDKGVIESTYMPDKKFVLCVQWHPEYMLRKYPLHLEIFKKFVEAC